MVSSFFKILIDPSADYLSLPPEFASMHLENNIPTALTIQSANGGYMWRLKIKQIGDSYCFANGWNNVVEDIRLSFGDFLVFRLVDQSTVKMSIYNPDGCEKILPQNIKHHEGGDDEDYDDDDYEKNEHNSDDDDPFFTSIITRTHKRVLRFPGGFAELPGIDAEGSMTVKNLDGKEWVTSLKLEKSIRSTIRYYLSQGWACFARENELTEGDECVFKFIRSEGKLLLAKVTKKKWPQPSNESSMTKEVKRVRVRATHEHGADVDVDSEEECVETVKRPSEMPTKRQRRLPPQQKSRVMFF